MTVEDFAEHQEKPLRESDEIIQINADCGPLESLAHLASFASIDGARLDVMSDEHQYLINGEWIRRTEELDRRIARPVTNKQIAWMIQNPKTGEATPWTKGAKPDGVISRGHGAEWDHLVMTWCEMRRENPLRDVYLHWALKGLKIKPSASKKRLFEAIEKVNTKYLFDNSPWRKFFDSVFHCEKPEELSEGEWDAVLDHVANSYGLHQAYQAGFYPGALDNWPELPDPARKLHTDFLPDFIVILSSTEEGIGKGEFCKRLFPVGKQGNGENFKYYTDALRVTATEDRNLYQHLEGMVNVQCEETPRGDRLYVDRLKQLITQTSFRWDPKNKHPKTSPRHYHLTFTTNSSSPVWESRHGGNRRVIPLAVEPVHPGRKNFTEMLEYLKKHRAEMSAWALAQSLEGARIRMSGQVRAAVAKTLEGFSVESSNMSIARNFLEASVPCEKCAGHTAYQFRSEKEMWVSQSSVNHCLEHCHGVRNQRDIQGVVNAIIDIGARRVRRRFESKSVRALLFPEEVK